MVLFALVSNFEINNYIMVVDSMLYMLKAIEVMLYTC